MTRQLDRPTGASHPGNREPLRRGAGDPPARPGSGGLAERVLRSAPPAAQEQYGNVGFSSDELQAPRGDHRNLCRLGHDRCRRTIPDRVLDNRQKRGVVLGLGVDHVRRAQAGLRQAGGVEIVPAACPKHRGTSVPRFSRGYTGKEQRGSRIVDQRTGPCGDLVQCSSPEPSPVQTIVEVTHPERQDPVFGDRHRNASQMGDALGKRIEGG